MSTRFVIWFEGRCGSSLLVSLLNNHDQILCRKENFCATLVASARQGGPDNVPCGRTVEMGNGVFRRQLATFGKIILGPTDEQALEHLHAIYSRPEKATGFKFKHPRQFGLYPEVSQALVGYKDELKVICLRRNNLIKRAISKQSLVELQLRLGKSNLDSPLEFEKLHVDVEAMSLFLIRIEQRQESFAMWANQFTHVLSVEYDDLIRNQEVVLKEITDFLNVDPLTNLHTNLIKATDDDLETAIANYDEMATALRGTSYEQFLQSAD